MSPHWPVWISEYPGAGGLLVLRLPRCHLMKVEGGIMELFLFPWGWGALQGTAPSGQGGCLGKAFAWNPEKREKKELRRSGQA